MPSLASILIIIRFNNSKSKYSTLNWLVSGHTVTPVAVRSYTLHWSLVDLECEQGWKPGYLALGCQFRCVETQMSGFSFGLVSRLLKNQFRFCYRAASVSGFQFRFKFHPRKLFYCVYGLFKSTTSWRFCFITMISSSSDDQ